MVLTLNEVLIQLKVLIFLGDDQIRAILYCLVLFTDSKYVSKGIKLGRLIEVKRIGGSRISSTLHHGHGQRGQLLDNTQFLTFIRYVAWSRDGI